jgi:uncharacterized protein
MGVSVIRSGLPLVLLLVTGQNLPAQEAVNKFQIRAGSALNRTEEYSVSMTAKGFLLRGTTHFERGDLVFDLDHGENIGGDGHGALQEIQMIRDGLVLESNPPETAKLESFAERQITFSSGGVEIPGTVCLPAKRPGKVPMIVMVEGSAPQDRDGKTGANYPFRDLAHDLAGAGVATLRYDKRTYAFPPPADPAQVALDWEVTNNALAALEFAATVPEAKSVFLLGHGLGGTMTPYIAARYPGTRGIVLMAAASSPIDLTLAEQKRLLLTQQGKSDQQIEEELTSQNQILADIRAGKIPATRMINGAPASYWLDWMKRDPAGELKKLDLPVLILQGGRDSQVYQADYDRFQRALQGKDAEFVWLPNLNHLFMPAQREPSFDYAKPSRLDSQVAGIIASWVKKIGARAK